MAWGNVIAAVAPAVIGALSGSKRKEPPTMKTPYEETLKRRDYTSGSRDRQTQNEQEQQTLQNVLTQQDAIRRNRTGLENEGLLGNLEGFAGSAAPGAGVGV